VEGPVRRFLREFFRQDITQEYVRKWRRMGVPEEVIVKALDWARNYASGVVSGLLPPYERERMIEMAMPKALEMAEKWVVGVTK